MILPLHDFFLALFSHNFAWFQISDKTLGPGISLPEESFLEAKNKLELLDKKDAERRRTAELKNNLEGYIYATKEKVRILILEV